MVGRDREYQTESNHLRLRGVGNKNGKARGTHRSQTSDRRPVKSILFLVSDLKTKRNFDLNRCRVCSEEHTINNCSEFRKMDVDER